MIVNHEVAGSGEGIWNKAISKPQDRMQSALLTGAVGLTLTVAAVIGIARIQTQGVLPQWFWIACAVSAGFAAAVWLLRSATAPAAAMGGLVCFDVLLLRSFERDGGGGWRDTAMPSLLALFLLTFSATRFKRARKQEMGVAEGKRGRRASQVAANLGVAGMLTAGVMRASGSLAMRAMLAACVAALAEATADTVSSEIGQALDGRTLLITTGRPVAAGTDGGVSLAGTACGALAAALVVLVCPLAHDSRAALPIFAAACAGLVFDSVLGATLERKGWLGNDLVNFASTAFAAALAWALVGL